MTDFRTKGKGRERQVYPIGKRKPFGVPRELAFKDVQALRKEGKRARLIRTNRKLDLYAPYESVLPDSNDVPPSPENSSQNRKFSSYDEIEKAFSMSRSDAQAWADVHPELLTGSLRDEVERFNGTENSSQDSGKISYGDRVEIREVLGIDNSRGKLNLNAEDLKMFYGSGSSMKISADDGRLTFISMDPGHVAMIRETMETDLPNGYLDPLKYGREFSTEWVNSPPNSTGNVRWPKVDYENDSWTARLEGDRLRSLLNLLQKSKEDTVTFRLDGDTEKASVRILNRIPDPESVRSREELVESVSATSSRPLLKDKPTGWDTSERVTLSTEYLRSTIRTMLGRKEFQNPRESVLILHLKRDYPVEIDTRRIGPKGEHIEVSGIIAPRMED
jgi:hypothetical protein